MIKDDSALESVDFWYDLSSIEKYCNSILTYFNKDVILSIRLGNFYDVPRVNAEKFSIKNLEGVYVKKDKYNLVIPKLQTFLNEEELKQQISLRKIFLKHELSHICFTPMLELNQFHNEGFLTGNEFSRLNYTDRRDIQMIYNALEDVRIESLMGKSLEGTNDNFFHAVKEITVKNNWIPKIASGEVSPILFGIFVILRAKNIFTDEIIQKISQFENIKAYEYIYRKYANFKEKLSQEDFNEIIKFLKDILLDIRKYKEYVEGVKQKQQQEQQEENNQNDNDSDDESSNDYQNDESSSDDENETETNDSQSQNQNRENQKSENQSQSSSSESDDDESSSDYQNDDSQHDSDDSENIEDSDDMQADDSEMGDDLSDDDFDSKMEDDIEKSKNEDDIMSELNKEADNKKTPNNTSFEDLLKEQFNKSNQDSESRRRGDLNENLKSLENDIKEDKKDSIVLIDEYGNLKESSYQALNNLLTSTSVGMDTAETFSKMFSAVEVPLKEIWRMSVTPQKIKKTAAVYSDFVRKHTKEISLISSYFKNKFKDKKKITMLANKEDGYLNDQMLYKALMHKELDARIFTQVGKKISTHANFIFLLDFSGSMSGSKLKLLIKTMIILNEVLAKLGISFMIYSFSSSCNSFTLPVESMHRLIKSPYLRREGSSYYLKDNLSSQNYPFVFLLKKLEEKQSVTLKAFLGNIVLNHGDFNCMRNLTKMGFSIGHSTKEYECVVYLTKKYDKMRNKNLIIINDGHYDHFASQENTSIDYESNRKNSNLIRMTFDKIILDLLYERTITVTKFSYQYIAKALSEMINYKVFTERNFTKSHHELVECLNLLNTEFGNSFEYLMKKDFIRNKFFEISLKKQNDQLMIRLSLKKDFADKFTVNSENIKIRSYYVDGEITFVKSDKKNLYNIILSNVIYGRQSFFYFDKNSMTVCGTNGIVTTVDMNNQNSFCDQLYKNKIDVLRKNNWGIYGIGIQDANQVNYIGNKYSSVIHKTENLTKEISKIIH